MTVPREHLDQHPLPDGQSGLRSQLVADVQDWVVQISGAHHTWITLLAGLVV